MSRGDSDFSTSREDNNQQVVVGTMVNHGKKEEGVNQGQGASFGGLLWYFEFIGVIKRQIVDTTADDEENHLGSKIKVTHKCNNPPIV